MRGIAVLFGFRGVMAYTVDCFIGTGVVFMNARENLLRTIHHDNPEWVPNGMESEIMIHPPIVERPSQSGDDAFGVTWDMKPDAEGGTYPDPGGQPVTDLSLWRSQVHFPDLDTLDWSEAERKAKAVNRGDSIVTGFVEMGLFERSYLLLGMEEALIAFVTRPGDMAELVSDIADYKIDLIRRFDDAIDMDMIWYGDDWGTQYDLFLPPETWRRTIKPHTLRIYQFLKERDIIINQHSCGKIEAVFDDVVEMGADIWNPCQPCNNLAALKQNHNGNIAFCGGIDSQFVLGRPGVTAAEVRAEVRRRIDDLSYGGGYIAAPSHSVPYRLELISAMNEEIAAYGAHTRSGGIDET